MLAVPVRLQVFKGAEMWVDFCMKGDMNLGGANVCGDCWWSTLSLNRNLVNALVATYNILRRFCRSRLEIK